jgi:hypothetical protein
MRKPGVRALLPAIVAALTIGSAEAFAQDKPPLPETVTVTIAADCHVPPFTSTPAEEIARVNEFADAIALIDVTSVGPIVPTTNRLSCYPRKTSMRGVIAEMVKSAATPLGDADRRVEFDFEGVPRLEPGSRYLVFFDLEPGTTQWYPAMPFLIDANGRLQQVTFENDPLGWKSPINGLPLSEVVKMLRNK